ncbi:MAG: hypothetical protein ACRDRW_04390 [Pseudonocardiaceae bacterium]
MDFLQPINEVRPVAYEPFVRRRCERGVGIEIQIKRQKSSEQLELPVKQGLVGFGVEGERSRVETLEAAHAPVVAVPGHFTSLRRRQVTPEKVVTKIVVRP